MDFSDRLASHARLAILLSLMEEPTEERLRYAMLRILSRVPGRSATASLLEEILPDYGFGPTRDEVVAILAWLDRSRLVKTAEDDGVTGAMILDLGHDVASGKATVPGIAPAPTLDWLRGNLEDKSLRLPLVDMGEHLCWLADVGRALVDFDAGTDPVVMITRRGSDVALGRAEVDGVKSPSSATIMRLASNAARDRLGG